MADDEIITLSDAPTFVLKAEPDGKIIVRGPIPKYDGRTVILKDQALVLAWHEGKVRATIKKQTEPKQEPAFTYDDIENEDE